MSLLVYEDVVELHGKSTLLSRLYPNKGDIRGRLTASIYLVLFLEAFNKFWSCLKAFFNSIIKACPYIYRHTVVTSSRDASWPPTGVYPTQTENGLASFVRCHLSCGVILLIIVHCCTMVTNTFPWTDLIWPPPASCQSHKSTGSLGGQKRGTT